MAKFIAWALVSTGSGSPQSVLIRPNGKTQPADYRIPKGATFSVQMLDFMRQLAVEVVGDRFVVRNRSQPPPTLNTDNRGSRA